MVNIHVHFYTFGLLVEEEMLFKGKVYKRRMTDTESWMMNNHNSSLFALKQGEQCYIDKYMKLKTDRQC